MHNTVLYPTISGNYTVNMDAEGDAGQNAALYQDFNTVLGTNYTFGFDWATWNYSSSSTLQVSITGTGFLFFQTMYTGTFAALTTNAVQHVSASFVGTGNLLRLEVKQVPQLTGTNDNTYLVDDFSINAAVPEAPTAALWLAGAAALGVAGRRRLR